MALRTRRFATQRDEVDARTGAVLRVSVGNGGKHSFRIGNHVAVLSGVQSKQLRGWLNDVAKENGQGWDDSRG